MTALTKTEKALLRKPSTTGGRTDDSLPEDDAELVANLRPAPPAPPSAPVDPWDMMAVTKQQVINIVRKTHPENVEFDDSQITEYAMHYTDKGVHNMIMMIGRHMADRLDKRDAGKPHADDPVGKSLSKSDTLRRG